MIKIYGRDEFREMTNWEIVDDWDFPIEELDYLLEEHDEESFVLINNRLYEVERNEE